MLAYPACPVKEAITWLSVCLLSHVCFNKNDSVDSHELFLHKTAHF